MDSHMPRESEPESMDIPAEVCAYAHADFSEVNQAFVDRLMELAGDLEEARAVDLGTGPGDIPLRVARQRPGWYIIALDASRTMLEHARAAVREAGLSASIELMLADAKDTGLPTDSFDAVFSNSILHHINEADRFWAELKRLAKPGAIVLLRDLARPVSREAARQIVRSYAAEESTLLQEEYYRSLLAAYTPDEVKGQLQRAGLESLQVTMATDRHLDIFGSLP